MQTHDHLLQYVLDMPVDENTRRKAYQKHRYSPAIQIQSW